MVIILWAEGPAFTQTRAMPLPLQINRQTKRNMPQGQLCEFSLAQAFTPGKAKMKNFLFLLAPFRGRKRLSSSQS
jgi:hypothetical protein